MGKSHDFPSLRPGPLVPGQFPAAGPGAASGATRPAGPLRGPVIPGGALAEASRGSGRHHHPSIIGNLCVCVYMYIYIHI